MPPAAIRAAAAARNAHRAAELKLLTVPFLSASMRATSARRPTPPTISKRHPQRAKLAIDAGCDGVDRFRCRHQSCRAAFPHPDARRQSGYSSRRSDDRATTGATPRPPTPFGPAPTISSWTPDSARPDPRAAADDVIREIDTALRSLVGE